MSDLIKDFTPLFSKEKMKVQQIDVQNNIASLLTFLNTHRLLTEGGAELYKSKDGYEPLDLRDSAGYKLLSNTALSRFMSTTLAPMAEAAYQSGDTVYKIAQLLRDYNPDDPASGEALSTVWNDNAEMLQNLLYLYSEYLYKVFMDNPYQAAPVGLKRS